MLGRYAMAGALGCALLHPAAAAAAAETNTDRLLRLQAEEIAELKARVAALEGAVAKPATALATAAPAPVRAPRVDGAATAAIGAVAPPSLLAGQPVIALWNGGSPTLESADGRFTFRVRGRVALDVSDTSGSRFDDRDIATTGARILRFGAEGTIGSHLSYQFETEFARRQVEIVGAFVQYADKLPVLGAHAQWDVRLGNLINERSLEGTTGPDQTPFMERNVVATAIIPQRSFYGIGAQGRLSGDHWHVAVQVTGDDVDNAQTAADSRSVFVRAHYDVPIGEALVHLGAWGFDEQLSRAVTTISTDADIGGRFDGNLRLSSGPVAGARGDAGYGGELGGFAGPFWTSIEYGRRTARAEGRRDATSTAFAASTGLFLFGGMPGYSSRNGVFVLPKVYRPVPFGGAGALELLGRYERLRFDNLALGGVGSAATLGLNWYLAPNLRLSVNGIRWSITDRSGRYLGHDDGNTVTARAQVSF